MTAPDSLLSRCAARALALLVAAVWLVSAPPALAATNIFFDAAQTATGVTTNINAITIRSLDYLFTYSVDGFWAPYAGGTPTGRYFSVFWPTGIQAQAITAGPQAGSGANLTIKRVDGKPFDLWALTGKLLANTAGAGASFEITPMLNGNEPANPFTCDATGYGGQSFPHTPRLAGYDTYKIHLWNEWALTALTLIDTNPPIPPAVNFTVAASASPVDAGVISGAGTYASNTTCAVSATPNTGWGFKNWTVNGTQVSSSANYSFAVRSNRTLVANFVPAFSVSVAASPNYGAATLSGGGTFNSNATVTVRATPASGFQFVNWTDYGNPTPLSTSTNYSFNLAANRTLIANFAPLPQTAIFDFDTGTPSLSPAQTVVGSVAQSNRGVTATISPIMGGWSFQTASSEIIGAPGAFTGLFLSPSSFYSSMKIQFSEPLTDMAFDFMTGEIITEYTWPGTMRSTAHTNSTASPAVGVTNVQGSWTTRAYPDGHLAFHSSTPFDVVVLEMAPVNIPSWLFWVDNIVVQRPTGAPVTNATITALASPPAGGIVTGGGIYATGAVVNLSASANAGYAFSSWTEGATVRGLTTNFSFVANSNRTLTANFAPVVPSSTITATVAPAGFGSVLGQGTFTNGSLITLMATANFGYTFVDWTEGGAQVCATTDYAFAVVSNRTLVANFTTNQPPVAVGNSFYQVVGQPLAINLYDLVALDYDPDSWSVAFVRASATTANGLALTVDTNAMQILVPQNSVADSFSYTITDGNGGTNTGTATISIINAVTSQGMGVDLGIAPGVAWASFAGVPWYSYTAQRATNATFTGMLQTWSAQAWADGSIYIWDDFADLGSQPSQAFYRLTYP